MKCSVVSSMGCIVGVMVTLHGCALVEPEHGPAPSPGTTAGSTGLAKFAFEKNIGSFWVTGDVTLKYAFDISTCDYNLEMDNENTEISIQYKTIAKTFTRLWKPSGINKFSSDVVEVYFKQEGGLGGTISLTRGNEGFKTWNLKFEAGWDLVSTGLVDLGDHSIPLPTPLLSLCKTPSPTGATQDPTPSPTFAPVLLSEKRDVNTHFNYGGNDVSITGYVTFKYAFDLSKCYFNVEIDNANTELKFTADITVWGRTSKQSKTWVPSSEIKFSSDIVKVDVQFTIGASGSIYLEKGNAGFQTWKLGLGGVKWSPLLSMNPDDRIELMEYTIPFPVNLVAAAAGC